MNRTVLTTASARNVDLLSPTPADITFTDVTEHLAKANRYCGATRGLAYSVAQHSVHCAQAALEATDDEVLGAYLLCHDMHEAYLGDDTTPKKRALDAICAEFGVLAETIEQAFARLVERIDVAVHAAAGLPWPPSPEHVHAIKHFDRVLLATEWRDLMQCPPPYDFGVTPLAITIAPWQWQTARIEMHRWCFGLLPSLQTLAGSEKFKFKPGDDLCYYLGPTAEAATETQCQELRATFADADREVRS